MAIGLAVVLLAPVVAPMAASSKQIVRRPRLDRRERGSA